MLRCSDKNGLNHGPVDFHCHGVGPFDFTEVSKLDLQLIEDVLASRQQQSVLTLYLPKSSFQSFLDLMNDFEHGKRQGKYPHIVGFGLEGPLLASHGGTPEMGVWSPSKEHWKALSECGKKGLVYVIFSPDAHLKDSNFFYEKKMPSVTWIAEALLEGGVFPASGHFVKSDPKESASRLQLIFDAVKSWGHGPTITDHLYNDMPHNFKHAWRTPAEKNRRAVEISSLNLANWNLSNMEKILGFIPATMIRNARKGLVKICQNFDGEHVDLEIVKKTVELVGSENLLLMTDSIESKRLAGRNLSVHKSSGLLYQQDGVVAAGSRRINFQIENMHKIGLSNDVIDRITLQNPQQILVAREQFVLQELCAEELV